MRRIVLIVLAVLVVLVALIVVLPFVIPVDAYRSRIEDAATAATGRQLRIDGPLRLTVFPELGLTANKVTLANVPGAHAPYLMSMNSLSVGVKLIPLLSGHIQVSEVTLNHPEINLETDKNGHGNWALGKAGSTSASPAKTAGGGVAAAARANFQGLRITEGRVDYRNDATGMTRSLDHINLTVGITSLNKPVTLDGSLITGGEKISLDGKVTSMQALMDGGTSPVDLSLTSNLVQASFTGQLAQSGGNGMLKLETPNLRKLAAWAGRALPPGGGLGHMSLEGKLSAKGRRDSFSDIRLTLDKMTLTGALTLDRSSTVPFVGGTLSVDDLNLNPYLAATSGAGGTAKKPVQTSSGWSTKPIDLDMLGLMNAKLALNVGQLELRKLKIGKSHMIVTLNGGNLTADLDPITLYNGSGKAEFKASGRGHTARIASTARFNGLQIRPFLTDMLGIDRIEGTGAVNLDVSGAGASPNAIMHALGGKGAIIFKNGSIRGVDLAAVANTIQSALSGSATAADASTKFTEMGGTFTITKGVMTTKDFRLLSPFIRMAGAGNVNLGEQTIDFVVEPKAVASIKGQGGQQNVAGIGVPFRIQGKWSNPHYSPDLSGVATDILKSLTSKSSGSSKGLLQNFLGGSSQSNGTGKTSNPVDALKGLFGGGN